MNVENISKHVGIASIEARQDMAAGQWDEVMTDALYAACSAATRDEMTEARRIAETKAAQRHAVARIESDFGLKIKSIIETFPTEKEARAAVTNGDKGKFPVQVLVGQAYARLTEEGWLLDGQTTKKEDAEMGM